MKTGLRDIKDMERQKKEIQAQLAGVRNKTKQLNKIISAKSRDPTSSFHKSSKAPEDTVVLGNKTLNDLRPTQWRHKVTAATAKQGPRDINDIEPSTIPLNSDLKRIQNQHIRRTHCKNEIEKKHKALAKKKEKESEYNAMNHSHSSVVASMFPNRYTRGELPCTIEHGTKGQYLSWVCPLDNLDYDYYLPIFFDGLQCEKEPVVFLAKQGIEDMLFASQGDASRVIPSLKSLVRPLRNALSKFNVKVLLNVLVALRQLVQCADGIGEAMTPYYKQFLQPMNTFLDQHKNLGDTIDYGQRNNNDIGEEVRLTLEIMERTGSKDAFKFIKFAIPPYQSYKEGL